MKIKRTDYNDDLYLIAGNMNWLNTFADTTLKKNMEKKANEGYGDPALPIGESQQNFAGTVFKFKEQLYEVINDNVNTIDYRLFNNNKSDLRTAPKKDFISRLNNGSVVIQPKTTDISPENIDDNSPASENVTPDEAEIKNQIEPKEFLNNTDYNPNIVSIPKPSPITSTDPNYSLPEEKITYNTNNIPVEFKVGDTFTMPSDPSIDYKITNISKLKNQITLVDNNKNTETLTKEELNDQLDKKFIVKKENNQSSALDPSTMPQDNELVSSFSSKLDNLQSLVQNFENNEKFQALNVHNVKENPEVVNLLRTYKNFKNQIDYAVRNFKKSAESFGFKKEAQFIDNMRNLVSKVPGMGWAATEDEKKRNKLNGIYSDPEYKSSVLNAINEFKKEVKEQIYPSVLDFKKQIYTLVNDSSIDQKKRKFVSTKIYNAITQSLNELDLMDLPKSTPTIDPSNGVTPAVKPKIKTTDQVADQVADPLAQSATENSAALGTPASQTPVNTSSPSGAPASQLGGPTMSAGSAGGNAAPASKGQGTGNAPASAPVAAPSPANQNQVDLTPKTDFTNLTVDELKKDIETKLDLMINYFSPYSKYDKIDQKQFSDFIDILKLAKNEASSLKKLTITTPTPTPTPTPTGKQKQTPTAGSMLKTNLNLAPISNNKWLKIRG